MPRSESTPSNLFSAGKSFFMAARTLLNGMDQITHASAMPFYFLSGFAIELSLKSVVLRVNGDQKEIHGFGHNLTKALTSAEACGLAFTDPDVFNMVRRMSQHHKALTFRYVPDVESVTVPGPGLVDMLIGSLIKGIERNFDVWEDQSMDRPRLHLPVDD